MTHAVRTGSTALGAPAGITREERRRDSEELLDEESLAVLAILLAVSLEFGAVGGVMLGEEFRP